MKKYTVLALLPWPVIYLLSGVAFNVVYHIVRYRRRVVRENLACAFPELSEEEREQIEVQVYRNLCETAVEVIKGSRMSASELQRRVTLENPELIAELHEKKQSVQLLLMHQANFEWALQKLVLNVPTKVIGVYKRLHDAEMDELILKARNKHGGEVVEFKDAMRLVIRGRREYRWLILASDQAPISREKRYWHDFFGRPAPFYLGPQAIADVTRSATVFLHIKRKARGFYSARLELIAPPPESRGGSAILDAYIAAAERSIREAPGDWLWTNRKWKTPKPHELDENGEFQNVVSEVVSKAGKAGQ